MNKPALLISLAIMLSGCSAMQQHQATERVRSLYGSCDKYQKFVDRADCVNKIASSDSELYKDPKTHELITYSAVLAEKVRANQMTDTEAKYEIQRKKNQLVAEDAQLRATNAAANYNKPRTTNCYRYGSSVSCTSY